MTYADDYSLIRSNGRTRDAENSFMASNDDSRDSKVRTVLDKWEAAWNAADMNAMWQLATDEVHWVNVVGQHWQGKAEVQKAHQMNFDRLRFKDRSCKLGSHPKRRGIAGRRGSCRRLLGNGWLSKVNGGDAASRKRSHVIWVLVPRDEGFALRARRQRSHR